MQDNIYPLVNEILKDRQLSISGVTRELKERGIDEHRLVMTGYLRALKDLRKLNEVEIPPSKVYSLVEEERTDIDDIYSLIAEHIRSIDQVFVIPVATFVLSFTLDRPVFREEFVKIGLSSKALNDYLSSGDCAIRLTEKDPRDYAAGITKIRIPSGEPAYELKGTDPDILEYASCILIKIVRSSVNLSGLIPKTKSTSITDFG